MTIIDVSDCESTQPLLYTWEELLSNSGDAELRLCDADDARKTVAEKSVYGFPIEFNNLSELDINEIENHFNRE